MQPEVLDRVTAHANNGTNSQTSLLIVSGMITPGITFVLRLNNKVWEREIAIILQHGSWSPGMSQIMQITKCPQLLWVTGT